MIHFWISPSLKPVSAELGFKAPVVVLGDDPVVSEEDKKQTRARKSTWALSTLQVMGMFNCHKVIYFKESTCEKKQRLYTSVT